MIYILSIIFILLISLFIGNILSKIGKKNDELGIIILRNALSKSMLLTIGLMILSLTAELIGVLFNISFLISYNQLWSILIVSLISILVNLKIESKKYFSDEE
ncbi:hypothetical protein [Enterococcus thailandicus]|uniref:Uncharacterized protein n=1 Tax=Enterococcus thailandicus TaxID=417368 RepID=A0A179ENR0_ENTTH|nr:hypothetical protein [Enterococcus thailandicus]MDA3965891.1 hypothetical protein [Enterococcus thailandicus]MDT2750934.1 hypothetical protein [Enterococcus thailandicus]MDT2775739.1 hypothetical protein [Enterococcus thailandicus]MDT2794600.1 hypothetical protein [Enterococcus thailandicus]MDT2845123.1 hypothetical protein [Enterococcus thailandicus]